MAGGRGAAHGRGLRGPRRHERRQGDRPVDVAERHPRCHRRRESGDRNAQPAGRGRALSPGRADADRRSPAGQRTNDPRKPHGGAELCRARCALGRPAARDGARFDDHRGIGRGSAALVRRDPGGELHRARNAGRLCRERVHAARHLSQGASPAIRRDQAPARGIRCAARPRILRKHRRHVGTAQGVVGDRQGSYRHGKSGRSAAAGACRHGGGSGDG